MAASARATDGDQIGTTTVPIKVSGPNGSTIVVQAVVQNPNVSASQLSGFVEASGYVSMQAADCTTAVNGNGVSWKTIPNIGRDGSGVEPIPVTAAIQTPGGSGPRLEYRINLFTTGPVTV